MDTDEKKALSLLQQVQAISRDKEAKRKDSKAANKAERAKKLAKYVSVCLSHSYELPLTRVAFRREDAKRGEREKKDKQEFFAAQGRAEKRKAEGGRFAKKQRRE